MPFDLIRKGGRVIDGSGLPGFTADVAIQGGRIARIGRIDAPAKRVWNADGLVVAPPQAAVARARIASNAASR